MAGCFFRIPSINRRSICRGRASRGHISAFLSGNGGSDPGMWFPGRSFFGPGVVWWRFPGRISVVLFYSIRRPGGKGACFLRDL